MRVGEKNLSHYLAKTRDMSEPHSWDPDPDGNLSFEVPKWRFV